MDTRDHGTKSDPKGTFELCLPKNSPKTIKNRVAKQFFYLKNYSHEDWGNFLDNDNES
jgi:hypothetical protein